MLHNSPTLRENRAPAYVPPAPAAPPAPPAAAPVVYETPESAAPNITGAAQPVCPDGADVPPDLPEASD